MKNIILYLLVLLGFSSCNEKKAIEKVDVRSQPTVEADCFVSETISPKDWPYRYRITRKDGSWAGEVDIEVDSKFVPFDKMHINSQTLDKISFIALAGRPGKTFSID